jgi:hypothetical protein
VLHAKKDEHQHKSYRPPAAVIAMDPQLTLAPLEATIVATPVSVDLLKTE